MKTRPETVVVILSVSSVSLLFVGVICLRIAKEKSLRRRLPSRRYPGSKQKFPGAPA